MATKLRFAVFSMLLAFSSAAAWADAPGVPRCWSADQPGQEIQDGAFRVLVRTQDLSAQGVAQVLFLLQGAMAKQTAVGTTSALDTIEIDLSASVADWKPSAAFPTRDALKSFIQSTLSPVVMLPGVTIECLKVVHPHPVPATSR